MLVRELIKNHWVQHLHTKFDQSDDLFLLHFTCMLTYIYEYIYTLPMVLLTSEDLKTRVNPGMRLRSYCTTYGNICVMLSEIC